MGGRQPERVAARMVGLAGLAATVREGEVKAKAAMEAAGATAMTAVVARIGGWHRDWCHERVLLWRREKTRRPLW